MGGEGNAGLVSEDRVGFLIMMSLSMCLKNERKGHLRQGQFILKKIIYKYH